jgi:hypothetical protein
VNDAAPQNTEAAHLESLPWTTPYLRKSKIGMGSGKAIAKALQTNISVSLWQ